MNAGAGERLAALDLIRGVAVLGILAVNIAAFAGPLSAVYSPRALPHPVPAGDFAYAVMLVLFEGKMRALFTLLFGAGIVLFVARADAAGRFGVMLQARRLGWLALFGYLHFLLWWGDILFLYAVVGAVALLLVELPRGAKLSGALLLFTVWHVSASVAYLPGALAEQAVAEGTATPSQAARVTRAADERAARDAAETRVLRSGFADQARDKLIERPGYPLRVAWSSLGETLPLMLLGMLLVESGFFSGGWSRRALAWVAAGGIGIGGAATAVFAGWAWRHGWPHDAMAMALHGFLAFPHLAMAIGYAALLVLWTGRGGGLHDRLTAAGRMAFSNYIATTLAMTALFYGWGLGLFGRVPAQWLPGFVALGWALMLGWSTPWLARFRQGPLEWLWRSLVERRRQRFMR